MTHGKDQEIAIDLRVVLGSLIFFLCLVVAVYARPSGPFVLVVTPPEGGAAANMDVIGKAEGRFVWSGRVPWISVAFSTDTAFADRLRAAGALLVMNHRLALGCEKEN